MTRTLRIACRQVPNALDREQTPGLLQRENMDAHLQVYEPLLTYAGRPVHRTDRLTAELASLAAESCTRASDGRSYRVRLRSGIRSSAGNELSAEDILWTFRRSLALGTIGSWVIGRAGISEAGQVRIISRAEVELHLDTPSSLLPHLLTVMVPAVIDSAEAKRHATKSDPWASNWLRSNSAGFGPYVARDIGNGVIGFVANRNYWQGQPAYDAIAFQEHPEADSRWDVLRAGGADLATDLEVAGGEYDDVVVQSVPSAWRIALGLNCSRPPFNKVEVRQAIARAIPYDRIVAEVFGGRARRMTSCIPALLWGHVPTEPTYDYQPEVAARLLRAVQPDQPVRVLYHTGLPEFAHVAGLVAQELAAVGLGVSVWGVSEAAHDQKKLAHEAEIVVDHFAPQVMDARYALGHDVNPPLGGVFDITGYHSPEISRALRAAEQELDEARIRERLADVQRVAMTELPWIPLAEQMFTFGLSRKITGYQWYPLPRIRCRDLRPA